jgi:hypothetical protein
MTFALMTPFGSPSAAVELSRGRYRKQILKFQTINYTGRDGNSRKITFDRKFGIDLVRAFKDGAYDQVPFQLADASNTHTNDPTRTGGEIVGVELSADGSGVDGIFDLWGSGIKTVEQNPKLGVSARIIENLQHSDGRHYPRALQHVLGTVDPQVTRMKPWEKVSSVELAIGEMSGSLDLSNEMYEGSVEVGNENETTTLELSPAQAERLTRLLDDDEAGEALAEQLRARNAAEVEDEDDEEFDFDSLLEEENDLKPVELSGASGEAIELMRAEVDTANSRILELTSQMNQQRTDQEVLEFSREGLAPAVLEAARPLLAVTAGAIELSNGAGDSLDPGEVIRNVLTSVIELAKSGHLMVDPDTEDGSIQGADSQSAVRDAMLADWDNYS